MAGLAYPIQNKHSRQNRRNQAKPALAQSSYKSSYSYMPRCRQILGRLFREGVSMDKPARGRTHPHNFPEKKGAKGKRTPRP